MPTPSVAQKKFLVDATTRYRQALPGSPADEFLAKRGLGSDSVASIVDTFRLGYVHDPLPGHAMYRGWLAIPYLRRSATGDWSVVSIRFRCLTEHEHQGHGKYMTTTGDRPRLFNTPALLTATDQIAICEGELDTITAAACGLDAVGVPGVDSWQKHYTPAFLGYDSVLILADADDAGQGLRFAERVAGELPNARIVPMVEGHDVNSMVMEKGKRSLLGRIAA